MNLKPDHMNRRLENKNVGYSREDRNANLEEFVAKARSRAVEIWKDTRDRLTDKERNRSPYICVELLNAMKEAMGDDLEVGERMCRVLGRSWEMETVLVTMTFPEFPGKYAPFGVYTVKDTRRYGWFGKPDEKTAKRRLEVVDEMIALYEFLKEQGVLC